MNSSLRSNKKPFGSRKGLTIVEVMFVAALSGFIFVVITTIQRQISKYTARTEQRLDATVTDLLAIRRVMADLQESGASFNNLLHKDDAGREFFDHLGDGLCRASCERNYTLKPGAPALTLLLPDTDFPSARMFQPAAFYQDITDLPPPEESAPLVFLTSKVLPELNSIYGFKGLSSMFKDRPAFTLMFYSPVSLRPVPATGNVDLTKPGRSPFIVRVVEATGNMSEVGLGLTFNERDPASGRVPASLDEFLRKLPPVGGAAALGFVRALRIVQYEVDTNSAGGRPVSRLLRRELKVAGANSASWSVPEVVASPIKEAAFRRRNITIPSIEVTLVPEDKKPL